MFEVTTRYSEDSKNVTAEVYRNRKIVTRVITNKTTGLTLTEMFKEGEKRPTETFVYNKIT